MFSSLRDKAKEPPGKVPCGGHFRIRQNLPEHAQGWLGSKWLWLFFVIVLYVILKFRGDSEKNKVRIKKKKVRRFVHHIDAISDSEKQMF